MKYLWRMLDKFKLKANLCFNLSQQGLFKAIQRAGQAALSNTFMSDQAYFESVEPKAVLRAVTSAAPAGRAPTIIPT